MVVVGLACIPLRAGDPEPVEARSGLALGGGEPLSLGYLARQGVGEEEEEEED